MLSSCHTIHGEELALDATLPRSISSLPTPGEKPAVLWILRTSQAEVIVL